MKTQRKEDALQIEFEGTLWVDGVAQHVPRQALTGAGAPAAPSPAGGERPHGTAPWWESLSPTERRVVERISSGHTNAQIAEATGRSIHTVRNHVKSVFRKAGVTRQLDLVLKYRLLNPPAAAE